MTDKNKQSKKRFRELCNSYGIYRPIVLHCPADIFEQHRKKTTDPTTLAEIDEAEREWWANIQSIRLDKLQKLRLLYGRKDDLNGWMGLASILARQLYKGFDIVETPPKTPKNKMWSREARITLVMRVRMELAGKVLLKSAIGKVKDKFRADYAKFSDTTLQTRYHESEKIIDEKIIELEIEELQTMGPLARLMYDPYLAYQAREQAAQREQVTQDVEEGKIDLTLCPP